jgi:hypothetical protein
LGFYWTTVTPVTQGYFEELYEAMPEKVSTVLAGAALPRGGEHTTLASWAALAMNEAGFVDTSGLQLSVSEVKVDPPNPGSSKPFEVVWTVFPDADFPGRKDKVQILDHDGKMVAEQTIEQSPIAAKTPSDVRATFAGLSNASYYVSLVVNLEGGDGTSLNEHGLQSMGSANFVVGDTRESQLAQDAPKFGEAHSLISAAMNTNMIQVRPGDDEHPPEMELEPRVLENLAKAADELASMDVMADGFKKTLGNAANWLRQENPHFNEEEWASLRGDLVGLTQTMNPDEAGKFAASFIEALEKHSNYPF